MTEDIIETAAVAGNFRTVASAFSEVSLVKTLSESLHLDGAALPAAMILAFADALVIARLGNPDDLS